MFGPTGAVTATVIAVKPLVVKLVVAVIVAPDRAKLTVEVSAKVNRPDDRVWLPSVILISLLLMAVCK